MYNEIIYAKNGFKKKSNFFIFLCLERGGLLDDYRKEN